MNVFRWGLFLVLALTHINATAVTQNTESAGQWLEKMATAMSQMNYQGTFVYVRDDVVETMRITHVTNDSGVHERLYSVTGPHREVIRDNKGVRCVLEDSASVVEDMVVASSYFPELPLSIIDGDSSGYRLEVGKMSRIAGYKARRISITPTDQFRYGYDVWLEVNSGLLLKWELFDSDKKPMAKLMFTDMAVGSSINLEELQSDTSPEDFIEMKTFSLNDTVVKELSPRWQPAKLPPGFNLASYSHKAGDEGVYEHMVYSDGLAAVSVYVEESADEAEMKAGASQLGTNNAYTRKQGDLQITVIGEVPSITVKSIANEIAQSVASN